MKVLWFSTREPEAVRQRLGLAASVRGGWIESLLALMKEEPGVELGVAGLGRVPYEPFEADGVRYFSVPAPSGVGAVSFRWTGFPREEAVLRRCLDYVDSFRPDLIHVHGAENMFGLMAGLTDVPVLVSLQGFPSAIVPLALAGVPRSALVRDILSREFLRGNGLVHSRLQLGRAAKREQHILRTCRYFAGRTAWDRDMLMKANPAAAYYHCDEVLRPEFYDGEWQKQPDGRFVIYCTANATPYKGLGTLLRAVAMVGVGGRPIRLRVGGRVRNTNSWPGIERTIERLGLAGSVEWLGSLQADEVAKELAGCDAYVHPSLVDNSPNALCEAMQIGAPCVASAVGGIPSLLKDAEEGLLFPAEDPSALAERIRTLVSQPELAASLGRNARKRALLRHDPQTVVRTVLDIYSRVCSADAGRRPAR